MADWKPYGVEAEAECHMPLLFGVYGWTALWLDRELLVGSPEEVGLRPSAEPLLGGVRRLPTLVNVVAVGAEVGCE